MVFTTALSIEQCHGQTLLLCNFRINRYVPTATPNWEATNIVNSSMHDQRYPFQWQTRTGIPTCSHHRNRRKPLKEDCHLPFTVLLSRCTPTGRRDYRRSQISLSSESVSSTQYGLSTRYARLDASQTMPQAGSSGVLYKGCPKGVGSSQV
jgi:hypothetical protein